MFTYYLITFFLLKSFQVLLIRLDLTKLWSFVKYRPYHQAVLNHEDKYSYI